MRKKPAKINLANIPTPLEEIEFEGKKFLMKRDDLSEQEATEMVLETKEALEEAINTGNLFEADEVIMNYLGLEPDYVFDILEL